VRQPPRRQLLNGRTRPHRAPRRQAVRGAGLLDGLLALLILSVGLLGMTRLQARMLAQGTEVQQRLAAAALADELLARVRVDIPNRACYTLPASGTCASVAARVQTDHWGAQVVASLPGGSASVVIDSSLTMTVLVQWTGKAADEPRRLELRSDVRD